MNEFWEILPWLGTMAILILFSAFFSACEAALFSLRVTDRRSMIDGSPAEQIAVRMLNHPEQLLTAVLFWNLVVNIAYFALSSMCAIRIERSVYFGNGAALTFAMLSLLVIIFFSEMLPKSIAVLKPRRLARFIAYPLAFAVSLIGPILPILQWVNLVSRRLIWPGFKREPFLEISDLERAIELSGQDAELIKQEQAVLNNVVQLSEIRVDEWMRPRSQFRSFRPPLAIDQLNGQVPPGGYLLITGHDNDEVQQSIRLDGLFRLPQRNVERIGEPVLYLPWCTTVADSLEQMSRNDRDVSVVVNEHGDTIGILTIEDILETVFTYAPSRSKRLLDQNPIHPIEPGLWLVSGMMSLRRLARALNVDIPRSQSVTVGGVIQETMQRLAQTGDRCDWGPFRFRVVEAGERGHLLVELKLLVNREAAE